MAAVQVSAPSFEHYENGLGIGHRRPRVSWRFHCPTGVPRDCVQVAYDLEVTRHGQTAAVIYHVQSEASVLVPWPGNDLEAREIAFVRVRAYTRSADNAEVSNSDAPTAWSSIATVEAAFHSDQDWSAEFITSAQKPESSGPIRPIRFRKAFSVPAGSIRRTRLYITALGVYEAHLNGQRCGENVMAPGWTSYKHRLLYQVLDVTSSVRSDGPNFLSIEVGEGWYAGRLCFNGGRRHIYGSELAVKAQLEITFESGEVWRTCTDNTWTCALSPIIRSEIYDGERYDMTQEQPHWKDPSPGFNDATYGMVKPISFTTRLAAQEAPPVRVTEKVDPVNIFWSPSGKMIVDFGQNLVGTLQVKSMHANHAGHEVSFTHVEVLENGEAATRPLRDAKCKDIVVLADSELRGWSPKFTFHGFRYVQVDGWPNSNNGALPSLSDFKALVLHTDMRRTGWFSCSNQDVNRLHQNVDWSMRGNFLSVPTDCPQRDERLGWTGDIQIFAPTASFLYDTSAMLSSWLEDVADEQAEDGKNSIPGLVVPDILPTEWAITPQAVWCDVALVTPWDLYRAFGDLGILQRQYNSMKSWLDNGIKRGPDGLWDSNIWQLGDWLDPHAPPEDPGNGRTDGVLVADMYLVHVLFVMTQACTALGLSQEADIYQAQAAAVKSKFQHKYITPAGLLAGQTQTAIALSIEFDLYADTQQLRTAAESLSRLVRSSRFRISTGFAGTPIICNALSKVGHTQLAYRMLLEKHCPSWLYPVTMGATTIWERWDSMLPNGQINPGEMTSFNHYALGSVANWLHSSVGGISPLEAGWKTFLVQPRPGGDLTSANVMFESPYGNLSSFWTIEKHSFTLELIVPPNCKALVVLPSIDESSKDRKKGGWFGSGEYKFACNLVVDEWPPALLPAAFWGSPPDCCF